MSIRARNRKYFITRVAFRPAVQNGRVMGCKIDGFENSTESSLSTSTQMEKFDSAIDLETGEKSRVPLVKPTVKSKTVVLTSQIMFSDSAKVKSTGDELAVGMTVGSEGTQGSGEAFKDTFKLVDTDELSLAMGPKLFSTLAEVNAKVVVSLVEVGRHWTK